MGYIIGTEDFKKHLDAWLFRAKQTDAEFLSKNRTKIPQMFRSYNKKLYRGMLVDEGFQLQIKIFVVRGQQVSGFFFHVSASRKVCCVGN